MSPVYYNENDRKAAAWLRELIKDGHIPYGWVDERSICDVRAHELVGYHQQHFFAGIGGWAYALRLAGWPDDRPIRTGSCPCQPFSAAGKQLGTSDSRHLWPVFRDLITFGEPTVTIGEQVASALGREWLAGIRADLEGLGYEVGAADLCAASAGAPQIRQRLYWVANPDRERRAQWPKRDGHSFRSEQQASLGRDAMRCGNSTRMGDADIEGSQGRGFDRDSAGKWTAWSTSVGVCGDDGEWRRIEPSVPPVAPRVPSRVALIRGSGNAIVPQCAAEFIMAYMETQSDFA